jgi:N-acetylglucosamine kinase-like BadF-type ATPase
MALQGAVGNPVTLPTIESILTGTYEPEDVQASHFYSAWIGASGVDTVQDVAILEPLISRLLGIPRFSGRLIVANDAHILTSPLFTVAESMSEAVVAIAGTGSVVISFRKTCHAVNPSLEHITRLSRAGGWGYLIGDEGSGFFAGRETIRAVLREFEESQLDQEPTSSRRVSGNGETLASLVLSHFELSSPDELLSVVYAPDSTQDVFVNPEGELGSPQWARQNRKERICSLAPLVFRAAFELKDRTALNVLRTSARGLAEQISSICHKAVENSTSTPNGKRVTASAAVLCLGGSLNSNPSYRSILLEELQALGQVFQQIVYVDDASGQGALGLAKLFA